MLVWGDEDPRLLLTGSRVDVARRWCLAVGLTPRPGRADPVGTWVPAPAQDHGDPHPPASPQLTEGVCLVVETGPDAGQSAHLPRGTSTVGREGSRVVLRAPGAARRHATFSVGPAGVVVSPLDGPVTVDGRRITGGHPVDERSRIGLGEDEVRLLPARPGAASPPPGDPERPGPGPVLPRAPWLALIAALAPLGIGALLFWLTDSWFMLLFGTLGLITAGPVAIADLAARRRLQRASRARARRGAGAACLGYPSPGSFLAAWGAGSGRPEAPTPPSDRAARAFPARLGPLCNPRVTMPAPEPGRRGKRWRVRSLPLLIWPANGERIGIVAGHPHSDPLARAVLAWLIFSLRPSDVLEVAPDAAWPAGLLTLPGVGLAQLSPGVLARLTWTSPGTPEAEGTVELLRVPDGSTDAEWLIDPHHDRVTHGSKRRAFLPEGCSLQGLDEAARRRARALRTADQGHGGRPEREPPPGTLAATVGDTDRGTLSLDLVAHGPHALVAGTTGAGKSEFLRTWLLELVLAYPPRRLRLVLFDFKGGSTFAPFARLPHTECLVTDLDAAESERVLAALAVEVKRRERWLAAAGLADLAAAEHLEDAPAHLIVAVDEFRVLAEDVPEVLERLIRLATVGRSLGVHLVLSTQRPQGVISPEIRANVSLVIALRLASETESMDVIGVSAAAKLDPTAPGSAWVRIAGTEPQRARFAPAGSVPDPTPDRLIGPRLCDALPLPAPARPTPGLAERLSVAARRGARPEAPLVPAALPPAPLRIAVSTPERGVLLGLRQDAEGVCVPLRWEPDPRAGLALLAGTPLELGTVAPAALAQVLRDPLLAHRSVVLNGLSSAGVPLSSARGTVLAWAEAEDPDWSDEVLAAAMETASTDHTLLLWVLGLSAWLADGTAAAALQREARLQALTRHPGVVPIIAGTRELAGSRWLSPCTSRIYLPHGAGDESLALWPRMAPCSPLTGRGVLLGAGHPDRGTIVQMLVAPPARLPLRRKRSAVAAPDGNTLRVPRAGREDAPRAQLPSSLWVPPPRLVHRRDLRPGVVAPGGTGTLGAEGPAADATTPGVGRSAVGVASVSRAAVSWRPRGKAAIILGGPGSGRSSAAALLAYAWGERTAQWVAGGNEPPPETWAVVDDADTWTREESYRLTERLRSGGRVLATALASPRTAMLLPWLMDLDPLHDVVLLGPRTAAEAEGWTHRVPPDPTAPPGRAWLTPAGAVHPVRVQLLAAPGGEDEG
ncbi:MAG: hypothetical protein LBE25_01180 [Arthrobacter sp.]|nr:hypothetical protein [Arthrobacter sp.]